MNKKNIVTIENEEVEAVEIQEIEETEPQGFWAKTGRFVKQHKKGIIAFAVSALVTAVGISHLAKRSSEDEEVYDAEITEEYSDDTDNVDNSEE